MMHGPINIRFKGLVVCLKGLPKDITVESQFDHWGIETRFQFVVEWHRSKFFFKCFGFLPLVTMSPVVHSHLPTNSAMKS